MIINFIVKAYNKGELMPHMVIFYTANLERETNMSVLCRNLADTMLTITDEENKPVFPKGGTRVLAFPAPHFAIADGGAAGRAANTHLGASSGDPGDYAFVYLNVRMGKGRSGETHKKVGNALTAATQLHFEKIFNQRHIGITFQIDESPEIFNTINSNIHPLFSSPKS
jgi:5-carboxymethyl-2-hydroxymuconate isomerase